MCHRVHSKSCQGIPEKVPQFTKSHGLPVDNGYRIDTCGLCREVKPCNGIILIALLEAVYDSLENNQFFQA